MAFIDEQLLIFKNMIEEAIKLNGTKGKESIIRSSKLINLIHDAVKFELIQQNVIESQIYPYFRESKPEIKIAGFLKQKNQDVCVVPANVVKEPIKIDWGPMAFQKKFDKYGFEYSNNTLVINVRSQMSSVAKNTDTLFERTFAESLNLHMRYPEIVLGEVYLIPVNEYDDEAVKMNMVAFKENHTDIEKYISFFSSLSGRKIDDPDYMYERCALLIVDFSKDIPKLYRNSDELKAAGLISQGFEIECENIGFDNFARDILNTYNQRFNIQNIVPQETV